MNRKGVIYSMYKNRSSIINGFDFDTLTHIPISWMIRAGAIWDLHTVALSTKLSAKPAKKIEYMNGILAPFGFTKIASGTNRVVYKHCMDPSIVLKVGLDSVGISDNKSEMFTQHLLKPFCTKIFDVSQAGTVSISERCNVFPNRQYFIEAAGDIFDILYLYMKGFVMEDVGNRYFLNWGVRQGVCPVLVDFPYIFEADFSKLFCTNINKLTGNRCNGEIDYDEGFNSLVCQKCGKRYSARQLAKTNNLLTAEQLLLQEEMGTMKFQVSVKKLVDGEYVTHKVADPLEGDNLIKSDGKMWDVKVNKDNSPKIHKLIPLKPIVKEEVKEVIKEDKKDPVLIEIEKIEVEIPSPKSLLVKKDVLAFYKDEIQENFLMKLTNRPEYVQGALYLDDVLDMIDFGVKHIAEKFSIDEDSAKCLLIDDLKENYKEYEVEIRPKSEPLQADEHKCNGQCDGSCGCKVEGKNETSKPHLVAKQSRINDF